MLTLTQSLIQVRVNENEGAAALARAQKDAETRKGTAAAVGEQSRLEGQGEAGRVLAVGAANARATKLAVDAYGSPEFRLAEQNFAKFAEALTKINQPLVPRFLMSGTQGQENSNAGLIPTAMLSSMFGPDALDKLRTKRESHSQTQRFLIGNDQLLNARIAVKHHRNSHLSRRRITNPNAADIQTRRSANG